MVNKAMLQRVKRSQLTRILQVMLSRGKLIVESTLSEAAIVTKRNAWR